MGQLPGTRLPAKTDERWQRAVKYRYGLHPLSAVGSVSDPGGRFNIGDFDRRNFPPFHALYLAIDKDTALQETLGQPATLPEARLTPQDLALTNPQSETIVSVSGTLETVFDLRSADGLEPFAELIGTFTISPRLAAEAKRLLSYKHRVMRSARDMWRAVLAPGWRESPVLTDIPANSQILGQLVRAAGIEGVLYPSSLTGKGCLAIFPSNFQDSSAHITIDDPAPHPDVPLRIDASNWEDCELTADEVIDRAASTRG
jgi:hypothetical protein